MRTDQVEFAALLLGMSLVTATAQTNSLQLPPIADGPFKPDWNSLTNYQAPEWFRDAKFGIWAHWGPQCEPEHGDWYARKMYIPGDPDYKFHLAESFSMAGDTDRALALLEEAVNTGFHPGDFIAYHGPFFEPLRGTPRFEAIAATALRLTREFVASEPSEGEVAS